MKHYIQSAINTRLVHIPLFLTLATLFSLSAPVRANPEAGADYAGPHNRVYITSTSAAAPTVLRTVTVVCPVAGLTVARADAQFNLYTRGYAYYGITRNSTSLQSDGDTHVVEAESPDVLLDVKYGGISRSDSCTAGQTVTYRFVAYLYSGLKEPSNAYAPALQVVAYRDRY